MMTSLLKVTAVLSTASNFLKGGSIMEKWECQVCGYVYDPAEGDEASGVQPGTSFEDLPDDWVCPVCGVGKEDFNKI